MLKQMGTSESSESYSFYFSQYIYVDRGAYDGCHMNLRYGTVRRIRGKFGLTPRCTRTLLAFQNSYEIYMILYKVKNKSSK